MPYIKGSGSQKDSTLPAVKDVYYADNVYANSVKVALWQPAGTSAAFANDVPAPTIAFAELNPQAISQAQNRPPQQIPDAAVSNNSVEQGYRGTPTAPTIADPQTQTTGAVPTGTASPTTGEPGQLILPDPTPSGDPPTLAAWLGERLSEGRRGMWNRVSPPQPPGEGSGPPINPGNPNIIGMWNSIGLKQYTNNDQTAWCAGFMNFALKQCGYKWLSDASSWTIRGSTAKYGATSIPLNQGQPGDIALFSFGHVAFVFKANNGTYTFVGGNQGGGDSTKRPAGAPNNPVRSCVSESWSTGCSPANYSKAGLVGLWRPSRA